MNFCINIIVDPERPFTLGLWELADLLHASIGDNGIGCEIKRNTFDKNSANIVLGYHRLSSLPQPRDFPIIVYQLEQLSDREGWFSQELLDTLRNADFVWDYSERNVQFLQTYGIQARHVPIGFHEALYRIPDSPEKDIDVLFYGSLNPRRRDVLAELEKYCKVRYIFNVFGPERDVLIARAKIILNIHYYSLQLFEIVRVSYLLNNRRFVISEISADSPFSNTLVQVPYEDLVEACRRWLGNDEDRVSKAQEGYDAFRRKSMVHYIQDALQHF